MKISNLVACTITSFLDKSRRPRGLPVRKARECEEQGGRSDGLEADVVKVFQEAMSEMCVAEVGVSVLSAMYTH